MKNVFGRAKGNYLIVCHCYFMCNMSWHSKILIDATKKEAKAEAALYEQELNQNFRNADAQFFLLPDVIQVIDSSTPPTEEQNQ
ncbi:hypothetical protein N9913_02805 [Porticoccaceae bacterium]|nr:hypothetical protein [Porticoccaceae bacterium]